MVCNHYILKWTGIVSILMLLGNQQLKAQNVTLEWVNQLSSTGGYSKGESITTDNQGNVYVTGAFGGTVDFDPGAGSASFTAQGHTDVFVCKYSATGSLIWAKVMGGSVESDRGRAIALDKEGNVYTAGMFYGTADFDPGTGVELLIANSAGWSDAFISKLDKDGNFVWAKSIGGPGADEGTSIAVDTSGQVYIYGSYSETVDFDPGTGITTITSSNPSGFVLKLGADGNFGWVKSIGGKGMALPFSLALAPSGNIYLLTTFMGDEIDFDPGSATYPLVPVGFADFCVSKLDAEGNFVWAKQTGGLFAMALGMRLTLDSKENVITTGAHMISGVDFNPGSGTYVLTSTSAGGDIFVSKLDSAGEFIWARSTESYGKSSAESYGITTDVADNIYITGFFKEKVDFDPGAGIADLASHNYDTAVTNDVFVWKLDSEGNYNWAKQLGGKGISTGCAIDVDAHGNVYTTGSFADDCDFDPNGKGHGLISEAKRDDIFVHKMICTDTTLSLVEITAECDGYEFGGTRYAQDGTYYMVLPNSAGCDSTIALNLTITPLVATISVDEFLLSTTESYSSYQWLFNGNAIEGATDSFYHVAENGDYQVVVTNEKGCIDTTDIYVVTNLAIGDINGRKPFVNIYPNPAQSKVYINTAADVQIILTDVTGKVLEQENVRKFISMQNYTPGIYFVTVKNKNGVLLKTEKIIKQ